MADTGRDKPLFQAVVNTEEQHSVWPLGRELTAGWRATGFVGTREECLDHIERIWTDMRPLSLRTATTTGE